MHCPGRHLTLYSRLHFLEYGAAVRAFCQPDDRQQHRLFERSKDISH
jgi:hypothetical protein